MQLTVFEVRSEGRVSPTTLEDLIARRRDGEGTFWVDIQVAHRTEATDKLVELGISQDLIEVFLEAGHAARALRVGDDALLEIPARIGGKPPELLAYTLLCVEGILVSSHVPHLGAGFVSLEEMARQLSPEDGTLTDLVADLLMALSVYQRDRSAELRDQGYALYERMGEDPDSVNPDDILSLKRAIIDLQAAVEERVPVFQRLGKLHIPTLVGIADHEDFETANVNTESTSRRLDRVDRRVDDLQARYDAFHQEVSNRRLGRLTIISAIFLPLTLLAGIYGMNFEVMPELGWQYAYPAVLVFMFGLSVWMLRWFRDHGWVD